MAFARSRGDESVGSGGGGEIDDDDDDDDDGEADAGGDDALEKTTLADCEGGVLCCLFVRFRAFATAGEPPLIAM